MNNVNQKRKWLEQIRESKGLTQQNVADKTNISRQFYGMIENGERNPSVSVAKRIGAILDFDWTYFFNDKCYKTLRESKEKTANTA